MWTSGDPLGAVPLVTGILIPPSLPPLHGAAASQSGALFFFSFHLYKPGDYLPSAFRKRGGKQTAGGTQMTQPRPSNRGERAIFGRPGIYAHCVY